MKTALVIAAVIAFAIALEVVIYLFWRSSERIDWWQRIAVFILGALAITALLHYKVI